MTKPVELEQEKYDNIHDVTEISIISDLDEEIMMIVEVDHIFVEEVEGTNPWIELSSQLGT